LVRAGAAVALLIVAVTTRADAAEPSATAREAQIMSAFLYNFTKFVEWPTDRFADAADPIVLGIFGDSFIEAELVAVVSGRKVNGRELVVKRVATVAEVTNAHVVFVGGAEEARFADILPALKDRAVLTVGESTGFLDDGGVVRFFLEAQRLRFEINSPAAQRAHLKISSQLQKLAAIVRKEP
jgi:hypothetical protein